MNKRFSRRIKAPLYRVGGGRRISLEEPNNCAQIVYKFRRQALVIPIYSPRKVIIPELIIIVVGVLIATLESLGEAWEGEDGSGIEPEFYSFQT